MATETLGFHNREQRDELYNTWKSEGVKGITRYTTHDGNNPQIIWVVTRPIETIPLTQPGDSVTLPVEETNEQPSEAGPAGGNEISGGQDSGT